MAHRRSVCETIEMIVATFAFFSIFIGFTLVVVGFGGYRDHAGTYEMNPYECTVSSASCDKVHTYAVYYNYFAIWNIIARRDNTTLILKHTERVVCLSCDYVHDHVISLHPINSTSHCWHKNKNDAVWEIPSTKTDISLMFSGGAILAAVALALIIDLLIMWRTEQKRKRGAQIPLTYGTNNSDPV